MGSPDILGIACGTGAALFWAIGFVAARHGITAGFSPADIVFHRFVWAGLVFLPVVTRHGLSDLGGVGLAKGAALTLFGGPPLACSAMPAFCYPLAHGAVIQPSCAALGGLALASLVLKEKLSIGRALGAAVIVAGLAVIGADALATIGTHGLVGDLSFVTAGTMFAVFATLLRRWRIAPMRAVAVTSVVSLVDVPIHWLVFGFERMIALGVVENLVQLVAQGLFAGAGATYLFTRSVCCSARAAPRCFPRWCRGSRCSSAFVLGEVPSLAQLAGFAIVLIGFRVVVKA
jgi:drug/metabolite transporter (DMT)-like permease